MKREKSLRTFGGNLMGPYKDKEERNFEKAHLHAYLKGWEYFQHGFELVEGVKKPAIFKVL
jgi:hypothetical protein